MLLARQFRTVCTNCRNEFSRRDFIAHLTMDAGLPFINLYQQDGLAVGCRFEAQRPHFLTGGFIALRQQGHGSCGGTSGHSFLPCEYPTSCLLRPFERLTRHCRSQEGTKKAGAGRRISKPPTSLLLVKTIAVQHPNACSPRRLKVDIGLTSA